MTDRPRRRGLAKRRTQWLIGNSDVNTSERLAEQEHCSGERGMGPFECGRVGAVPGRFGTVSLGVVARLQPGVHVEGRMSGLTESRGVVMPDDAEWAIRTGLPTAVYRRIVVRRRWSVDMHEGGHT